MSSFPSVRLCSHPIHDVEVDYQTKFEEMPGVFHVPSPLWDERTVSCSAEQLNRFLHTLQFHGSKKGLFSMKISVSTYAYILPIVHISIPLMLPPLVNASIVEEFTLPLL